MTDITNHIHDEFAVHEYLWGVPCGPTLEMVKVTVTKTLVNLIRMDGVLYLKEKKCSVLS